MEFLIALIIVLIFIEIPGSDPKPKKAENLPAFRSYTSSIHTDRYSVPTRSKRSIPKSINYGD